MKKAIRIGAIGAIIALLAAMYVWFFVYNKPHENFERAKPEKVLSASQCFKNFSKNNTSDGGKVLEIYGIPSSIETGDSMVVVCFSFKKGMFGDEGIRCTMLPKFQKAATKLSTADTVYIKGFCAGYNGTDVIFENSSIINKYK